MSLACQVIGRCELAGRCAACLHPRISLWLSIKLGFHPADLHLEARILLRYNVDGLDEGLLLAVLELQL